MSGTFDIYRASEIRAYLGHVLDRAGLLVRAPVFLSADENARDLDLLACEYLVVAGNLGLCLDSGYYDISEERAEALSDDSFKCDLCRDEDTHLYQFSPP